jgi:hypothetical protein
MVVGSLSFLFAYLFTPLPKQERVILTNPQRSALGFKGDHAAISAPAVHKGRRLKPGRCDDAPNEDAMGAGIMLRVHVTFEMRCRRGQQWQSGVTHPPVMAGEIICCAIQRAPCKDARDLGLIRAEHIHRKPLVLRDGGHGRVAPLDAHQKQWWFS